MTENQPKVILPTTKSEIDNRWTSQKVLMIGPPKVGKSEFWSYGEKTLYLQCEAGLNHLEVMKLPIHDWAMFRDAYTALKQADNEGKFPYDTIVVDTIDKWIDLANDATVERGREKFKAATIYSIGDIPNGAGWKWSQDTIAMALTKLEQLPACIVLIGHLENKELKLENSVSIHKQTVALSPKVGISVCSWADHILNIEGGGKTGDRRVRTRPTGGIEAGSRGDVVPENFVWSRDNKSNYEKFRGLFK